MPLICKLTMCSEGVGLMAVMAVSGSILYVALRAHRQLVSDFKKRIEFEFRVGASSGLFLPRSLPFFLLSLYLILGVDGVDPPAVAAADKGEPVGKRVTFADNVVEPCSDGNAYRKRRHSTDGKRPAGRVGARDEDESGDCSSEIQADMPPNRVALYRGIGEERAMRAMIH